MASERKALQKWLKQGIVAGMGVQEFDLEEKDKEAKLKKVKISGLGADCVVLKPDAANANWFNGDGPNRRCDYLILAEQNNRKYALFIELKSGSYNRDRIAMQFKGAVCLLNYCEAVIEHFEDLPNCLDQYEYRFVVFYKAPSMTKLPSRPALSEPNLKPETALFMPDPIAIDITQLIVN